MALSLSVTAGFGLLSCDNGNKPTAGDDAAVTDSSAAPSAALTAEQIQQRAAVLNALAGMPAELDFCMAVGKIDEQLQAVMSLCPKDKSCMDKVPAIDSIAMGAAKGFAQSAQQLDELRTLTQMLPLAKGMAELDENEDITPLIQPELKRVFGKLKAQAFTQLKELKVAPLYAVATYKAGEEERVAQVVTKMQEKLKEVAQKEEYVSYFDEDGLFGLRIDWDGLAKKADMPFNEEDKAGIKEALKGRESLVLFKAEPLRTTFILSESVADVKLPTTAEESALSTPMPLADSKLGNGLVAAAWADASISNTMQQGDLGYITVGEELLMAIAKPVANSDKPYSEVFAKAGEGVQYIAQSLKALLPADNAPAQMVIWNDGDVHVTLTSSAQSCTYDKAPLKLQSLAKAPQTILYAESTGADIPYLKGLELMPLLNAGMDIAKAACYTLDDEPEGSLQQLAEVEQYFPLVAEMAQNFNTLGEGLSNGCGIYLDNQGSLPGMMTGGVNYTVPRIAFFSGVTNRAKLSEAWDGFMATTAKIIEATGGSAEMLSMVPIVPSTPAEGVTSYKLAVPMVFSPNFTPYASVSDTLFTLGTSPEMVSSMYSASGSAEFAGIVASLNFKPMLEAAEKSLAAYKNAATTEEDDEDDDEAYEDGVIDDSSIIEPYEVREARKLVEAFKRMTEVIQSVELKSTIDNDINTIQVDFIRTK